MPISKRKMSYTLDLEEELKDVKPSKRKTAAEAVGLALLDRMKSYLDEGISPVSGKGQFKELTSKYKKMKRKLGKGSKPNLQLFGDMTGNLKIEAKKTAVTIKLTDSTEKKKGFNHNVGDTLPRRQWMPDDTDEQKLKDVNKVVKAVVREYSDEG